MNLNAIAAGAAAAVNPPTPGTIYPSTGYTTAPSGKRTPSYGAAIGPVPVQVQALTAKEIQHIDALNIQGVVCAAYFNGKISGMDRAAGLGGDKIVINAIEYIVATVLENWDSAGWTKVALTKQTP